jgi:hypothetical protein
LKKLNRTQTEKNPSQTGKKLSQIEKKLSQIEKIKPNQNHSVRTGFCSKKPNQTKTDQFELVSVDLVTFFDKN